ncbi:hypothetical protein [Sphingorhabdus sp.]|uniref:hypothetical protein n=1 Tax=Sphingorhabdus sp. TaxID=1902408 RepID=UPI0025E58ACE|nr:hypothetical protein [Sphingorhabdus sp.]
MEKSTDTHTTILADGEPEVRRYRIFNFDFDSRPLTLSDEPGRDWSEESRAIWEQSRKNIIASIRSDYGENGLTEKIDNFRDFGAKPFSIVAHHNVMFDHVRTAFIGGGYYAALTGACALGERILNHMMLDLRDHFKATPEYKKVYRKSSFDRWRQMIHTLVAWGVLLPEVSNDFLELERLRNRSIHFTADTATRLREDALCAIGYLKRILEGQFAGFGLQPWFISGTMGAGFIKKEWETHPFVSHYYCAKSCLVGPFHSLEHTDAGWQYVDYPSYHELCGLTELTDDQFKDLFNDRDPACLAQRDKNPIL